MWDFRNLCVVCTSFANCGMFNIIAVFTQRNNSICKHVQDTFARQRIYIYAVNPFSRLIVGCTRILLDILI